MEMPNIVGLRFKRAGRIYYFDPLDFELSVGDWVVVKTARGTEAGRVVIAPKQVVEEELSVPLKPIVRKIEEEELHKMESFKAKEAEALEVCATKIQKHNLPMKLTGAEFNFDGTKLTFYFTSEGRVDFRELVRDLASHFKTRIELRQIGVRDEAKMMGCLGRCGLPLCCASFLGELGNVSIKMAKEQDLPLNPMKISGICGRLMCCLAF